ncbi:HAD family hydrolase [Rhodovibrionaceae bacterium A322]
MPPKLVIFDCDGVIVDSVMAHCEVLSRNLQGYGLSLSPLECRDKLGAGKMSVIGQTAELLGACLPPDWTKEIYAQIFARLEEGVALIDGIEAVLDQLDAAGVAYCVASNGSKEKMALMLRGKDLLPRFEEALFSAHTLGVWKPNPNLFLAAAQDMGVGPQDCVVIEDSPTGVLAARRAGMLCFGYAPDGSELSSDEQGVTLFRHMRDLPALLHLTPSAQSQRVC